MILYIQDENYHFDGYISGVIVDDDKVALFEKSGITEHDITLPDNIKWHELDSIKSDGNDVEIKAKNYAFYRKFFCLNKIKI